MARGEALKLRREELQLGIDGFRYADLYDASRLEELAKRFDSFLEEHDSSLYQRFTAYRGAMVGGEEHGGLATPDEAKLLIDVARHESLFVSRLFRVDTEAELLRHRAARDSVVAAFKKEFVVKRVAKFVRPPSAPDWLPFADEAIAVLIEAVSASARDDDAEYRLATTVNRLLEIERDYPRGASIATPSTERRAELAQLCERLSARAAEWPQPLAQILPVRDCFPFDVSSPEQLQREAATIHRIVDFATQWTAFRRQVPSPMWNMNGWSSFALPQPLHFDRLVDLDVEALPNGVTTAGGPAHELRRRDGFALTDRRFGPREVSDEAHYCIYCHERKKDSCSHGFLAGTEEYKRNPLGVPLEGCPLEERIGEMNLLRAEGDAIGALTLVMVDNPMCPGTGHRICNDCMKSCIFQKQEPVDIPQIETGALTDVLFLPWGFEIYALLTRWNPVNVLRPVIRPYNGRNILVVGLGPAGYTLAHHLAGEGFGVIGIDALKIEPLPKDLVGDEQGPPVPVRDLRQLWDSLDDRILAGFGGVSEYGITVRWDKNFLKCIRLALERMPHVRFYGGLRFGGTITIADAFDGLEFDHIAIAAGAGTPTLVRMKNNLIRGIRKASDFLMALQLTGAYKWSSLANLQVRLPAVVVGGGLTAIDTATELFAYYPRQVEKVATRYEVLCTAFGEETVRAGYDAEELEILDEFLAHGRAVIDERRRADAAGEKPDFIPLVRSWGGVTIAYRKGLVESPAYRLNHEEVSKAMEEGIWYAERLSPVEAVPDQFGHLAKMRFDTQVLEDGRWRDSGRMVELPARSVMVAAGTSPNVIYEKEHPGTFRLDKYGHYFQGHVADRGTDGEILLREVDERSAVPGFFTSYRHERDRRKLITFYGDNHPVYAGNVVKAMASAKYGYRHVTAIFDHADVQPNVDERWKRLVEQFEHRAVATVAAVNRLTPTIVEVVVRAPWAAERFLPGQFFRLQNFETHAAEVEGTRLTMEGIALTGAWTDPAQGLLSLIVLEMGGSSRLCATLRVGEPVVVMGPTGTPTELPSNETVLLAGGGLGNAVLFSIARALKENGCKVLYFAGYKNAADVFKRDEIEAATDQVIWSVDRGDPLAARRENDLSFVGNIVESLLAYGTGEIFQLEANRERTPVATLAEVTRIIAIGSDGMMRAVRDARRGVLAPHLSETHIGIGSINSPMQCMMKQVCAQCLQRHVDPVTGKESFVFSCFNQDQELDRVDFDHLRARLRQNTVLEKLTNLWLTKVLASANLAS